MTGQPLQDPALIAALIEAGIRLSQSGNPSVEVANLFGLLILTGRDKIRDVIAGQIEDMLAVRPGMVDANRQARLAEIDAEILNAEMSE